MYDLKTATSELVITLDAYRRISLGKELPLKVFTGLNETLKYVREYPLNVGKGSKESIVIMPTKNSVSSLLISKNSNPKFQRASLDVQLDHLVREKKVLPAIPYFDGKNVLVDFYQPSKKVEDLTDIYTTLGIDIFEAYIQRHEMGEHFSSNKELEDIGLYQIWLDKYLNYIENIGEDIGYRDGFGDNVEGVGVKEIDFEVTQLNLRPFQS